MNNIVQNSSVVAVFDFDGTLTYCDTLAFFLFFIAGPFKAFFRFFYLSPWILGYLLGFFSRQTFKERVLTAFLKGKTIQEIQEMGKQFAQGLLQKFVKKKGLKRIHWHLSQGHRCILISASLDVYLEVWAKGVGFQDVIASRLEVSEKRYVTGRLKGKNCRGEEKVKRLEALLGPKKNYQLYAYGDSRGDKELLRFADHPYYRIIPEKD